MSLPQVSHFPWERTRVIQAGKPEGIWKGSSEHFLCSSLLSTLNVCYKNLYESALSFNLFYLLACNFKIFLGEAGIECISFSDPSTTLNTKCELKTLADVHCVDPHKTKLEFSHTDIHTHTFTSSSAVFLELLCAYKSEQKNTHF